jgi:hypothetical protein
MIIRPRTLPLLVAMCVAALVAAGCGGGDDEATSNTDVDQLLRETFSGDKKIESGRIDLGLEVDAKGGSSSQLQGPISLSLKGPFQSQGKGKLPKFDLDAAFEGAGQSFKAGLTSTGDKGFVNWQGQEYAVSDQVFRQFKAGFEQAQKQAQSQSKDEPSLATLGIDPRRWLKDAKNAGETKVGDADVIRITAGVDIGKLLDDVNNALSKARGLGVQGSQELPEKLTEEQKRQAAEAIKALSVEIYTGAEDKILRRMVVGLDVEAPQGQSQGAESASLKLDFSLLDLNEEQDVQAPANAKPFEELAGALGGLGLGGGSSGSGSGSSGSGGATAEDLQEYSECIEKAGSDTQKAQDCAKLLEP